MFKLMSSVVCLEIHISLGCDRITECCCKFDCHNFSPIATGCYSRTQVHHLCGLLGCLSHSLGSRGGYSQTTHLHNRQEDWREIKGSAEICQARSGK